jgi:DNA-binding Lrp family transcriptional regulator
MDKLDCRILQLLQADFPLCQRPYELMAQRLQITGDELFDRVDALISKGLIRRIGASLDSRKLGFSSTLAAVSVRAEHIGRAAEIICRFTEVTHTYLRSDRFNIWFTIIASDNERIENIIKEIQAALSLESSQILNLPVKHLFKLNTCFNILPQ